MTSTSARNGLRDQTIASLKAQTIQPDDIRLYADVDVVETGIPLVRVLDRGPLTKLSAIADPSVHADDLIVTVDDDIIYERRWLETLLVATEDAPSVVVGRSGWNVADFLRDEHWGFYIWVSQDGHCDVVEGWAGVAYRKSFFNVDVLDPPSEFKLVDDVWISGYLNKRGIARRIVTPQMAAERPGNTPGLHNRPDFLKINRRAARMVFAL
jgi:hypothetical protein